MWRPFFLNKSLVQPNWEDEFYRHDFVGLLTHDGRPVGFHLYGLQNLHIDSCKGTTYIKSNFNEDFLNSLASKDFNKAMSLNWLTIDVLFSQKQASVSLIELMGGLGLKVCESLNYDVTIAAIRNDIPLAKKSVSFGGVKLGEKLVYDTPCDLIYIPTESLNLLPEKSCKLVDSLWEQTEKIEQIAA